MEPNKMLYKTDTHAFRDRWISYIHELQDSICQALEDIDGQAKFITDEWQREGGGGGITRVIADGAVFEKGGVNTSVVWGKVTDTMRAQLKIEGSKWFASGLSLVIHPLNPYVPTTHANWRYFELYDEQGNVTDRWFGGGSDLTPRWGVVCAASRRLAPGGRPGTRPRAPGRRRAGVGGHHPPARPGNARRPRLGSAARGASSKPSRPGS